MSQNDFNLANQGFPSMRSDMNSALQALASNSAGDTEPSTTYAYQWWYDETIDILKIRNSANDAWINVAYFDQTADAFRLLDDTQVVSTGGTQTGLIGGQANATWETGTGTIESLISPAQAKLVAQTFGGQAPRLFAKADATAVAWTKTGNGTAETQTTLYAEVNGSVLTVASGTSITMPSLSAGTDYAIWAKPDGGLEATSNHTSPPVANARKVGGFHYAPGGNAAAQSGGDTTPQINEYSFYDLKWKPACSDPRGMTLVGGGFWVDIYLTGVDAITNGSSAYNVTIADGSSPPKVPTMFGGNGSATYGSYTWFEAQELATAFGKRTLTQIEFMAATYGTTEGTDGGSDPGSTILRSNFTSKWGVMLATGNMWVWGRDRGGEFNTSGWNDNTEGRGQEFNAPNAVLFGGYWSRGSKAGSRCSFWLLAASFSFDDIGSRFACDHLTLE